MVGTEWYGDDDDDQCPPEMAAKIGFREVIPSSSMWPCHGNWSQAPVFNVKLTPHNTLLSFFPDRPSPVLNKTTKFRILLYSELSHCHLLFSSFRQNIDEIKKESREYESENKRVASFKVTEILNDTVKRINTRNEK